MRVSLRWRRDSDDACSGAVCRAVAGDQLEAALWTIPAQSMKAGREHHVPLSGEVPALLRAVRVKGTSSFQVASVALSCRT